MNSLVTLLVLTLVYEADQRSTPQDASYVAAVVEFQVGSNADTNINRYIDLIRQAAEQNADVVVFPELTIGRGAVPVPLYGTLITDPIPALAPDLYDQILVSISATARLYEIYVVINLEERLNCTEPQPAGEYCPAQQVYLFNTNVVFDRSGAVIDRYRKINLFGEFTRTPALRPELGVFTTDFGVTFGHFICFDLLFQVPAIQVVEQNNITDVIFTTMWFSELPYLTAVEIQEAYAYSLNVNFIASGANNVRVGSAGSGIYSGRAGALVSTMPGLPTTRLLVSRVPKIPGQVNFTYPGPIYDNPTDHDSLTLITDPSLPSHVTRPLEAGFQEFTLVDKEVSCRFRIRLSQRGDQQGHVYRAMVRDGSNRHLHLVVGVASCAVIACKNEDIHSCPYKFSGGNNSTTIQELTIHMTTYRHHYNETLKCDNVIYYPVTLQSNKFPLEPKNFVYIDSKQNGGFPNERIKNGREHLMMALTKPQDELVTFGVYSRIYHKDVLREKIVTEKDKLAYLAFEKRVFAAGDENSL